MKISKELETDKVIFNLTGLDARQYEAIYRGLKLLEERPDLHKGVHAPKMLEAMKKFRKAEPEESEG